MCDINAYLLEDDQEKMVLENVEEVRTEGDLIFLSNIFGEEKTLKARMKSFINSGKKMILEPIER